MQCALVQIGNAIRRGLGLGLCLGTGTVAFAGRAVAQDDSASVGPPPHFAAAWGPVGTLIDVSRTGVLRQRLSVDVTDVPLQQALAEIRDRGKIELAYDLATIPAERIVSLHAKGITVASALGDVLMDTGLDVFMTRTGQLALLPCSHLPQDGIHKAGEIAGRVIDRTTGAPLVGAIVTAEGTRLAATTNGDGKYRLSGLAAGTRTLTAKFIGFAPTSAGVTIGLSATTQDFALSPSVQRLDQVVVTGALVPTEMKAIPTPITVITADEIQRRNVQRVDQLFRGQTAGAFAWDPATLDHAGTITLRGANSLEFNDTFVKIFVDGIEAANPAFVATIDPNSIERIELIRGPQASTLYGSDAIGGVMQIFLKKGRFGLSRPEGDIKFSAGIIDKSEGSGIALRHEEVAALRGGRQRTSYELTGYYRHDGEWTPSYRNANWNVTLGAQNVEGPLTVRISARYGRKVFDRSWYTALRDSGYIRFSTPPFETIESRSQTYGTRLLYSAKRWWRHDLVLGYDRSSFDFHQTRPRPGESGLQIVAGYNEKASVFYSTTVDVKPRRRLGAALTAGFNSYLANATQTITSGATRIVGSLDGTSSPIRQPFTNSGLFAQAQLDVAGALFLTAGLRRERNTNFGAGIGATLSPRAGASYIRSIGPTTAKFRVSYGESIRPPGPYRSNSIVGTSFEQLANPALGPERQRGVDGGVDVYVGSQASLSVTYYRQVAADLIAQVFDTTNSGSSDRYQYENIGRIDNNGWEVEGRLLLTKLQVSGALSTAHSRVQRLSPGYRGDYHIGDRPLGVPRMVTGLTLSYLPFGSAAVRGTLSRTESWTGRNLIALYGSLFGGVPSKGTERAYWMTYPGFTKLDMAFEYEIRNNLGTVFQVNNLTNNLAFELENLYVPVPRTLIVGLRAAY